MDTRRPAGNSVPVGRPKSRRTTQNNNMEWTRSETLALASHTCTSCHGLGMRTGRRGGSSPCNCVFRAIFRACYKRFRYCVEKEKYMSRVSLEHTGQGGGRRYLWGRKDEEYIADFTLVSRRTLTAEEYQLFKYHYLLGADWKLCCRKLKIDRGTFFHAVYRVQQKLGKVFRELEPYGLYPLDEYFGASKPWKEAQLQALDASLERSARRDAKVLPLRASLRPPVRPLPAEKVA